MKNLRVLFVCENNFTQYTAHSKQDKQGQRNNKCRKIIRNRKIGKNKGKKSRRCHRYYEGYNKSDKNRWGPGLIELETYRWREHCGPNYDNDIGYRTEEEFEMWKDNDPLGILEKRLIIVGKWVEFREKKK